MLTPFSRAHDDDDSEYRAMMTECSCSAPAKTLMWVQPSTLAAPLSSTEIFQESWQHSECFPAGPMVIGVCPIGADSENCSGLPVLITFWKQVLTSKGSQCDIYHITYRLYKRYGRQDHIPNSPPLRHENGPSLDYLI